MGGRIESQDLFSSNFEQKSTRALVVKKYRTYRLQINDFGYLFSIEIKVNTDKAFSINKPDLVLLFNKLVQVYGIQYPVFVSKIDDTLHSEVFREICEAMDSLLKKIKLTPHEAVFIARNVMIFALRPDRDFVVALDDILDVLVGNKRIFKRKIPIVINKENIPNGLRHLIPLLKKYCVADDMDRTRLAEGMSKKKKLLLIEAVDRHMDEINLYLSSFEEYPLSEEAVMIGRLAELVSELKIEQ